MDFEAWFLIHGIIMTIVWCVVADVLLLVVRYCKNWQRFIFIHSRMWIANIFTVAGILLAMWV